MSCNCWNPHYSVNITERFDTQLCSLVFQFETGLLFLFLFIYVFYTYFIANMSHQDSEELDSLVQQMNLDVHLKSVS